MNTLLRSLATLRKAGIALLFLLAASASAQYLAGDYGAVNTGLWNSTSTWKVYNGVSWASSPVAAAVPNANSRVYILTGSTVTAAFGSTYSCADLIIEPGAKLFNNNTGGTNLSYVQVYGTTITVDGQLGNGATLDGISLGIDGPTVSLSGTGTVDVARISKRSALHPITLAPIATTDFIISMNVNLRFSAGSTTMMYNASGAASNFNVTIGAGVTVALLGAGGTGNIAMDGLNGGDAAALGGSYTVNGTLLIPGILYLTTNNTNVAQQCRFTINNGGYVRAAQLNSAPSLAALHVLTINAGGTLEVTGTPTAWTAYSPTGNTFTLNAASQFIYSGAGGQDVRPIPGGYGSLRLTGAGIKALSGATTVKGSLEINNAFGSPVLDVTASNFAVNLAGNWSNYAQSGFEERMGVVYFNGTASNQSITTPGGEIFRTLQIGKSGPSPTVQMNSNVTVQNTLNLAGGAASRLDLNGNLLTITNPAGSAITGGFGTLRYIFSERTDNASRVAWAIGTTTGAHLIPFGRAGAYMPFTFNLTSGDAGTVTVATYGTPADNLPWPVTPTTVTNLASTTGLSPDNRDATVDRFWQVDVTGTPVATLTFGYAAAELPTSPFNDPLALRAQRWDAPTQSWQGQLEGSGTAYNATANTVTTFGPFTLSAIASPLPVELLYFEAKPEGEDVRLEWATATELDNALFTVYRSADGRDFTPLLNVPGAGTSLHVLDYLAFDREPLDGLNYYRLRQTDLDGTWTESDVVVVRFDRLAGTPTLYPNPATDLVHLMGLPTTGAELRVVDMTGRVVSTSIVPADQDRVSLPVAQLPAGTYRVLVTTATEVRSLPFVRP
jgi:hypothetical protein